MPAKKPIRIKKSSKVKSGKAVVKVLAWCMKCKAKRTMTNPEATKMKNGRDAIKGSCPECNTGMYKIGKL